MTPDGGMTGGDALAAFLEQLPGERQEELRARVRAGVQRLRERGEAGEVDMSVNGTTETDRDGVRAAPQSSRTRAHDWAAAEHTLARMHAAGRAEEGTPAPPVAVAAQPAGDGGAVPPGRHFLRLSEIASERLRWLSPGRLAAGKITVLDGDPGLGKSTLLCELAARVTRGEALPGGTADRPRGVVLLSAEDDLQDTIRPRLDAAGGDPEQVMSLLTVPDGTEHGRPFVIPGDVPVLARLVQLMDAALVIVDPLVAFLDGKLSANNDQDVRRALAALKGLAERSGAAIVAVRHLNKAFGTNPLYRGGGSIGIIGAARCGLLLAQDPDDPERRILAVTKGNLARAPVSLAFRLEDVPGADVARLVWDGESHWTAGALLREADKGDEEEDAPPSALEEARVWLREALAAGPRPAKAMQAEATARGIGETALKRARRSERVIARKERVAHGGWTWSLPRAPVEGGQLPGPEILDPLDPLDPLSTTKETTATNDDGPNVGSPLADGPDPWDQRCVACGHWLLPDQTRLCASCAAKEPVASP